VLGYMCTIINKLRQELLDIFLTVHRELAIY